LNFRIFLFFATLLILCSSLLAAYEKRALQVGAVMYDVEVVQTVPERRQGLSGRSHLKSNCGMLFVYKNHREIPAFWMKGMLFPIDIIWISNDEVIQITSDIPVERCEEFCLQKYSPYKAIDHVLEINAGEAKEMGIQIGDRVKFR